MSRENLVEQIIYTHRVNYSCTFTTRTAVTGNTKDGIVSIIEGLWFKYYVIMTTAHVQAAAHECTTIIMLLY